MFGSTVPFILFFHDTPAWIMNSKYYFTFFVGWLISVTLLQLFPRFLTCTPINAILSLGMNFSMSHVVLNAIERTLKNFSSNQLLISFLVAFVAGCGSHFVFFRKRSVDQMEHQRITFVWLLTFNMYFLLLKPEFYYKAFLSIPNIDNYSLENLTEKGENFDDLLNSKSYKDIPRAFKLVFGYFIDYAKSYVDEKPKESKYFPASLIRDIIPILVMAGVSSYSFIVYLISSIGKMCKKCQSPSPKKKVKTN
eukprot:MONOS_1292.1-p1 / transcript=MONOS_1292.1 / gene=MONOS_1292 / organism=Monocercomonoides_exilis_PA203 / gene_product=unspecified product / transcript_product=unspecified product / location=Mono_scaffold00022:78257-79234(+) / protein_length=251 / sequence_SO=supercontig / SO=protein_coding / is_pseudo=false